MERFVHDQNLTRYLDQLQCETDSAKRGQLRRLLVEEIDRFGAHSDRLNETDRLAARCMARLDEQRTRVARLRADGHDAESSESLLANLSQTLEVIEGHRQTILDQLDRSGI
jgi:hypothetical protein